MGRRAGGYQTDVRSPRHPGGRAQVSVGRFRAVRVRSRLSQYDQGARRAGRALLRHGHRGQEIPRDRSEVFSDGDSAGRQQVLCAELGRVVGRIVHLRAAGRDGRDAAASLFPDQRREHGPVRTHADHRRQGRQGALYRRLHRAEVFDFVAAFGGSRADRNGRRIDPVYDDPELVPQYFQPRY